MSRRDRLASRRWERMNAPRDSSLERHTSSVTIYSDEATDRGVGTSRTPTSRRGISGRRRLRGRRLLGWLVPTHVGLGHVEDIGDELPLVRQKLLGEIEHGARDR